MNPTEPRLREALEAALRQIRATAVAVADRVGEMLSTMAESSTRIIERDLMLSSRVDLLRNLAAFHAAFTQVLVVRVQADLAPKGSTRRPLAQTDWQSLSLVGDHEVEEQMVSDRIAQQITHECESELRELNAHMLSLLRPTFGDDSRNPLRPEIVGAALYAAVEAATEHADMRKLLARDMGWAMARAMPVCYAEIVRDLKARGVRPSNMTVRSVDGPGTQMGAANSGYTTAERDWQSTGGGLADGGSAHAGGSAGGGAGSGRNTTGPAGARTVARGPRGVSGSTMPSGANPGTRSGATLGTATGTLSGGLQGSRSGSLAGSSGADARGRRHAVNPADAQLMVLLRRLTALASRPGELDGLMHDGANDGLPAELGAAHVADQSFDDGLTVPAAPLDSLPGLMAVNLIRAHREELREASQGRLNHMVIDVVGSLFDQILSDSRVSPQMARQIARLQLPVLRVALNDANFFASRRHPVRRFVNRLASLACAFEDFEDGPGKEFITRVRELVQEIVDGDFDQIELYTAKLAELEDFIARQTKAVVEQTGTAATLETKESELRIQQRYMLQLQTALAPLALPKYLGDFLSQVWSQALVLAVSRDGVASDRAQRYRRVGRDLVMSVQPKGSPTLRKKFLMTLPPLMKDLYEGMTLLGWSEAAQKEFFAKLMPAHAESLKGAPMSELDHNLMVKQLDALFLMPVPGLESLPMTETMPQVEEHVEIERRFTPEEAKAVGLVKESAVDWSGKVDIDLSAEADADTGGDAADLRLGVDINLDLAGSEPHEPSHGKRLMDHIQLGFAYQMHLNDEWQKVRLTYVSPGRSFFVFSRGKQALETVSMTQRMLARMCETGRLRAFENAYLMERATHRARKQLAAMKAANGAPTTRT
jgi:hypothetical protein